MKINEFECYETDFNNKFPRNGITIISIAEHEYV